MRPLHRKAPDPKRAASLALAAFAIAAAGAIVVSSLTPAYSKECRLLELVQSQGISVLEGSASAPAVYVLDEDAGYPGLAVAERLSFEGAAADSEAVLVEEASVAQPARSVRPVEEFLQYPAGLPAGCEPVSLTLALRSLGFDAAPEELIDEFLPVDETWTDPSSYWGSPYVAGGSFPTGIVNAANAYLAAQGADLQAVDASGADFEELSALAAEGVPVLVWTTMYGGEPEFTGQYIGSYAWYTNEHCVLMYGLEDGRVLVSDPLEGLVSRDADEFGRLYEACGSHAVYLAE